MKILITGGAGYCGSVLTNNLLREGHEIVVYDAMFYGERPSHVSRETTIKADIRDIETFRSSVQGCNAVVHLACISNDASFELDEKLSTDINLRAFEPLVIASKEAGVKRFVYASSSSVYGVSDAPEVTEDHPLVPLTLYNRYKAECEPILFRHTDENFVGVIFRPATVCGYSPRQRLDLVVNIFVNQAVNAGKITVFGGEQQRPNLHIQDYCKAVLWLLETGSSFVGNQIFNVGGLNQSLNEIAAIVQNVVADEFPDRARPVIEISPSQDPRSYRINSDKINRVLGFKPRLTIETAIRDLCDAFRNGLLPNSLTDDQYFNVKRLKRLKVT